MLFPILSLLVGTSIHRTVARTKRNGIFVAIAAVLLLTAYTLAVVAGAIWLSGIYGPIGAALFLAAAALLTAGNRDLEEAQAAERSGQTIRAYLLYSQIAKADPGNT